MGDSGGFIPITIYTEYKFIMVGNNFLPLGIGLDAEKKYKYKECFFQNLFPSNIQIY